jgi:hypothetical protein
MPSVVELLGYSEDKAITQSGDREPPPPLSYLKAAVGLTVPSSLTRTNFSLGVQVKILLTHISICVYHVMCSCAFFKDSLHFCKVQVCELLVCFAVGNDDKQFVLQEGAA